jgi:uncharacterized membrane protein HdeD (DUF308 family)
MDQKFASTKLGTIVSGVALAAMGIILFTNPQSAMLTITVMLGWVLVIMGIVSLASALTRWSVILSTADLYAGIVELLFGVLLVNIPGFFVTWIFILLGIFILVSGPQLPVRRKRLAGAWPAEGWNRQGGCHSRHRAGCAGAVLAWSLC